MRTLIKDVIKAAAFGLHLNRLLVRIVRRPLILGFHRVISKSDSLLVRRIGFVTPQEFVAQLLYLRSIGYAFAPLAEAANPASGNVVAITFDDGFRDLYVNAFPHLKEMGAPFTLFLISSLPGSPTLLWQHKLYALLDGIPPQQRGAELRNAITRSGSWDADRDSESTTIDAIIHRVVNRTPKEYAQALISDLAMRHPSDAEREEEVASGLYLRAADLQEMRQHQLRIEAHGHEHWNLLILDPDERIFEISHCLDVIARAWGDRPRAYAAAHGGCDASTRTAMLDQGIRYIIAGRYGVVDERTTPADLPRIWPAGVGPEFAWMITRVLARHLWNTLRMSVASFEPIAQW